MSIAAELRPTKPPTLRVPDTLPLAYAFWMVPAPAMPTRPPALEVVAVTLPVAWTFCRVLWMALPISPPTLLPVVVLVLLTLPVAKASV